jgi:hypothetical protein
MLKFQRFRALRVFHRFCGKKVENGFASILAAALNPLDFKGFSGC